MASTPAKEGAVSPPREYNPLWPGYIIQGSLSIALMIILTQELQYTDQKIAVAWCVFSFLICIFIVLFDRITALNQVFNLRDHGNAEGYILLSLLLWWMIGVGFMTRVGGIAYQAGNYYFMGWGNLFASIYTLNEWTGSKDIISIHMLTRLSATLPGWYVLLVSSAVEFCSAANLYPKLYYEGHQSSCIWAIVCGIISMIVSLVAIFIHYKLITVKYLENGGVGELCAATGLVIWWIAGVIIITRNGGIAPSVLGSQCHSIYFEDGDEKMLMIPGSNLYLSSWTCLFSSSMILYKWKEAKAMHMARTKSKGTTFPIIPSAPPSEEEKE